MNLPRYLEIEKLADSIGESLSGNDPVFPARENLRRTGPINTLREFKELGIQSLKVLLHCTNLSPKSSVLDIGCGFGRLAIPLTRYLAPEGGYQGFDVMADAIVDCERRIGSRYPRFGFHHFDVHNGLYNPGSPAAAGDTRFMYEDGCFDLVFMFSVFTHMKPADVTAYLAESLRVLKPGGMLFTTAFLLNVHARAAIESGRTRRHFAHQREGFWADDADNPESAVAYDEEAMTAMIDSSGLNRLHTLHGQWANRRWALTGQDALVCMKPEAVLD